jgi:N,N'-diacetyllegionaminate synthase
MTKFIAEIGGNHGGDINKCRELAIKAWEAGADTVKFQALGIGALISRKYAPDRFAHFQKLEFSLEDWLILCEELKKEYLMDISFSVWDASWISALNKYVNFWKVGSGDITNISLLRALTETKKPIIISTAMSLDFEVQHTLDRLLSYGLDKHMITFMECKANYANPSLEDAALGYIEEFAKKNEVKCGYSHHSTNISLLQIAIARGMDFVEFHFTDQKFNQNFRDHKLSLDADDVRLLRAFNVLTRSVVNTKTKSINELEQIERPHFRRSIFASRDIKAGEILAWEDVEARRPLIGMPAEDIEIFIGKMLKVNLKKDDALNVSMFA